MAIEDVVLGTGPEWYYRLNEPGYHEQDLVHGYSLAHSESWYGISPGRYYSGRSYSVAGSGPAYSMGPDGFSVSAWIKPDPDHFPTLQSTGYVHWMGKGAPGQHEWTMRMYGGTTTDVPERSYRVSGYHFNPEGGLGVGAYFQDRPGVGGVWPWMHVVLAATRNRVNIYRDGALRNTQYFNKLDPPIDPQNGTAPMRIGTRDFGSYYVGDIAHVGGWHRALTLNEVQGLYLGQRGAFHD